jgi:hypothetical protein
VRRVVLADAQDSGWTGHRRSHAELLGVLEERKRPALQGLTSRGNPSFGEPLAIHVPGQGREIEESLTEAGGRALLALVAEPHDLQLATFLLKLEKQRDAYPSPPRPYLVLATRW